MTLQRTFQTFGFLVPLVACTVNGEAQRPVVVAAVGQAVEGISAEAAQRLSSDALRGLPVVVRTGSSGGSAAVIAEMVRTRLTERSVPLEVACPAKCLEVTLVELDMESTNQAAAGKLLPVNAGALAGLAGLPRTPGDGENLAAGHARALLVTFAVRDGNRYAGRQQMTTIVAIARPLGAR